jgi:hypothetical protein
MFGLANPRRFLSLQSEEPLTKKVKFRHEFPSRAIGIVCPQGTLAKKIDTPASSLQEKVSFPVGKLKPRSVEALHKSIGCTDFVA